MSTKDTDLRKKAEAAEDTGEDVVAHGFVPDEIADDDPERGRKRKRKLSDEPDGDGFDRKRK